MRATITRRLFELNLAAFCLPFDARAEVEVNPDFYYEVLPPETVRDILLYDAEYNGSGLTFCSGDLLFDDGSTALFSSEFMQPYIVVRELYWPRRDARGYARVFTTADHMVWLNEQRASGRRFIEDEDRAA